MQTMNISEASSRLPELCETVAENYEQVVLTREKGNVVMISMDEWEAYTETVRLLNDKAALKALLRSFENHDSGKSEGKPVREVFADLL